VLPPLKKGASTDNLTALQAIFLASTLTLLSLLTDEVLAPLKEGASTHNSPGLSSMIVTALQASIQQSTTPWFATTDATNHSIEREDDSLIGDIPSNLICYVSEKDCMKSPRLIPKNVSNQGKGQGDKFQIKCPADHWYDGASDAASGSHRQKLASQYFFATTGPKEIPKTPNRKARPLHLQHWNSDAGTVETQPPRPDLNVREASRVTPTKGPPDSYMEYVDSELSPDNDSKPPAKNSYSKRPARKKPIELTRAAKVGRPAEKHQEADEESSADDFQTDAGADPGYIDEDPSIAEEV
jgi:hypothetical protein